MIMASPFKVGGLVAAVGVGLIFGWVAGAALAGSGDTGVESPNVVSHLPAAVPVHGVLTPEARTSWAYVPHRPREGAMKYGLLLAVAFVTAGVMGALVERL